MNSSHILYYNQPAQGWTEALPVGNGILGGMVFGGIEREHIQLNEDSLWNGGFTDRNNADCLAALPKMRRLLNIGKIRDAEVLAKRTMAGVPDSMRTYQTLGQMILETGAAMAAGQGSPLYPDTNPPFPTKYQRWLDLKTAVAGVSYTQDDVCFRRECFASAPAGVLVLHLGADKPRSVNFHVKIERGSFTDHAGRFYDHVLTPAPHCIGYDGMTGGKDGIGFCCLMQAVSATGKVYRQGEYLCVQDADDVTIYLAAGTTYRHENPLEYCLDRLHRAANRSFEIIYAEHVADHQALYGRCSLNLETNRDRESLPTDLRMKAYREAGGQDPGLEALLFHYGRYLLIASSRPGSLPANLQGIWCYEFNPKWDSKFTININAQMNYWGVESCNLSELHLPFFDLLHTMYPNGVKTAKVMYGCNGWMAHHNTDLWGDTAPQDSFPTASYWVLGAAWMSTHVWIHYQYSKNKTFLEKNYFLMRDACIFLLDYMIENENGQLVLSPTVSPENTYRLPNGQSGQLCVGCTMDSQIVRRLFEDTLRAGVVLGCGARLAPRLEAALGKLPPTRIGPDGRVMEWLTPYEEVELGHRHISQLYGLYPGEQISPLSTPELAQAARKTIEMRMKHGGGHTGWSRVWLTLFWARLMDGEKAGESLRLLLQKSTTDNLLDTHPPFQIDGNLGLCAAVAEMLVQAQENQVVLLPALPPAWHTGNVEGLCLPGNTRLSMAWRSGKLEQACFWSDTEKELPLWYLGRRCALPLKAESTTIIKYNDFFTDKQTEDV